MNQKLHDCDVLIVGGGLVGSALAVALSQLPIDTIQIEAQDSIEFERPSFDARVTALANGSRQILKGLGIWSDLEASAEPITRIHISERGKFGVARLNADEEGVEALGYTIENYVLGRALHKSLRDSPRFKLLSPARFISLSVQNDGVISDVDRDRERIQIGSRVVVAADGAGSGVRSMLQLQADLDDYGQTAVVFNCVPGISLDGLAFERFTPRGPIAVLPLPKGRAGIVWTVPSEQAETLLNSADADLRDELAAMLGNRIGQIGRIGRRGSFPLRRIRSKQLIAERVALIGSAAVNLHPVAGQGFNLALRDVAGLAELFADALTNDTVAADIGSAKVLERYADWRRRDQATLARITHGLVKLFGLPLPGLGHARALGLTAFDLLPGAKSLFARHAMGRAGILPRLACGRSLIE